MSKLRKHFWFLFPVILMVVLIVGPIVRDGMFLDGLVYTNIARNLSEGVGSLWSPLVFRNGSFFYEHPVFLPYLESLFFRVLGDGLYVEDVYNFSVLMLTVIGLYGIWRELVATNERQLFFLPLLLWVSSQEVQLRYPSTMLECGTTLVLLTTTYCYLKVEKKSSFLAAIITGVGVFLAVLCKGPFGLFLLGLPFLHQWLMRSRFSVPALFIPLVTTIACFGLLFALQPEALDFFRQYLDQQVVAAIVGERTENIASTRFDFLYWLVVLNLPALLLCGLLLFVKPSINKVNKRASKLFLGLGLAAILPLAVSIKQAAYYQLISLPFFIIGLSVLVLPRVVRVTEYLENRKTVRITFTTLGVAGLVVALAIAIQMFGTTDKRDREIVALTKEVAAIFKKEDVRNYRLKLLGNEKEAASRSYRFTNFLNRYHNIHLDRSGTAPLTIYLSANTSEQPEGELLFHQQGVSISR